MIKGSNATNYEVSKKILEIKMLYSLLTSLVDSFSLNVFKHITLELVYQ